MTDWAPSSTSLMRPVKNKRLLELQFTEKFGEHGGKQVALPARKPPISYVHHSTHSMIMLGMASWRNKSQSCRHSLDQPVINNESISYMTQPTVLSICRFCTHGQL